MVDRALCHTTQNRVDRALCHTTQNRVDRALNLYQIFFSDHSAILIQNRLDRVLCQVNLVVVWQSTLPSLFCTSVAEYSAKPIQSSHYHLGLWVIFLHTLCLPSQSVHAWMLDLSGNKTSSLISLIQLAPPWLYNLETKVNSKVLYNINFRKLIKKHHLINDLSKYFIAHHT